MKSQPFNYKLADSQATPVAPVSSDSFDFDAYEEYESSLLERCRTFWEAESGVMVYRRVRVGEVFSGGCRNMKRSLELQLGGLQKSMEYKGDIPNFLEPWYGIGTIASSYGIKYIWEENQAPAILPEFHSAGEALSSLAMPVKETLIGRHTIEMIDYFLERTFSRLPISLTDTQSPLNIATFLVDLNSLFIDMYDNPEDVKKLLNLLADIHKDFTSEQIKHIGNALVWPGHGFASCRVFEGIGFSDDNAIMLSGDQYVEFSQPALEKVGNAFGGPVFHSCGDWSGKIDIVRQIAGLRMVDGAFSAATDPSPNPPEVFAEKFNNTGIVINARIVGDLPCIIDIVKRLWKPGMKLIVVTYCQTPEEQAEAYESIHAICET